MQTPYPTKQIRVERQKGYYGMFRVLKIVIDGNIVAELKQSETATTIDVPAGAQEIWGKMDWGKTKKTHIEDIPDGKILVFKAYFTLNPLRNMAIMKMPFKIFFR